MLNAQIKGKGVGCYCGAWQLLLPSHSRFCGGLLACIALPRSIRPAPPRRPSPATPSLPCPAPCSAPSAFHSLAAHLTTGMFLLGDAADQLAGAAAGSADAVGGAAGAAVDAAAAVGDAAAQVTTGCL